MLIEIHIFSRPSRAYTVFDSPALLTKLIRLTLLTELIHLPITQSKVISMGRLQNFF